MSTQDYFKYWGKYDDKTKGYHLLPFHSLDVAAVGQLLLKEDRPLTKDLAAFLDLPPAQLSGLFVFALALHDLGKFASAFQKLRDSDDTALIKGECRCSYDSTNYRHDRLGWYFWEDSWKSFFEQKVCHGQEQKVAKEQIRTVKKAFDILMNCVLGHHGKPVKPVKKVKAKAYTEPKNLDAAYCFIKDVCELLCPDFPLEKFCDKAWQEKLIQVSWYFAGLSVLADWVGSNVNFFPFEKTPTSINSYWKKALEQAGKALKKLGLADTPVGLPFQSFQHHFRFTPTPLQQWAEKVAIDDSPQLFILEDVTGAGKTEAALTLVHRLIEAGAAEGFYFGLPTMATSDAMFERVARHYKHMLTGTEDDTPSIVLAHSARKMNTLFQEAMISNDSETPYSDRSDQTITAQCNQWFADSHKKALLAPVGVGTVDQALLAVLPRRHQSLRLLGLNRKVLIFDEVHSADEYMLELLEALLKLHYHQGGSVILLTATLSRKQRQRLCDAWLKAANIPTVKLQEEVFPLATQITNHSNCPVTESPMESRTGTGYKAEVCIINSEQACLDTIMAAVEKGQCIVWIRNTVHDAQMAYEAVCKVLKQPEDCLLFHSRFILHDRKNIENKVMKIFGKKGNISLRRGKVLVATQVFQESLDVDTDVMISDICPIDDLIQRAGRLQRHTRNAQGRYEEGIKDRRSSRILYVHAPEWDDNPDENWLSRQFEKTEYVYRSPGRLWLGLSKLRALKTIKMPVGARTLIEAVYGDETEQIPESLKDKDNKAYGEGRAKAAKAHSQLLKIDQGYCSESSDRWTEDNYDISTRYSDVEIMNVLLLRKTENGEFVPWVNNSDFPVELSTVKIIKKNLTLLPEPEADEFYQRYRQSRYLQLWIPEYDSSFAYDAQKGFYENPH